MYIDIDGLLLRLRGSVYTGCRSRVGHPGSLGPEDRRVLAYGKGLDTETLSVGAGSLSFCAFSGLLVIFLWFPAGFLPPRACFRVCVSVAVFLSTERPFTSLGNWLYWLYPRLGSVV